jgi:hypothetical protein
LIRSVFHLSEAGIGAVTGWLIDPTRFGSEHCDRMLDSFQRDSIDTLCQARAGQRQHCKPHLPRFATAADPVGSLALLQCAFANTGAWRASIDVAAIMA